MTVMSLRALNRTLLRRQLLTSPTRLTALKVVEHLVAMQAQEPNWPYVGLWARMAEFGHSDLTALLDEGRVVRSPALRSTQHLVSSADYRWLRPTIQPVLDRAVRTPYFAAETTGLDLDELAQAGRELIGDRMLPRRELGRLLAERYPGRKPSVLAATLGLQLALVNSAPGSTWGGWGTRGAISVSVPPEPISGPHLETMVLRYLSAFGPATVADIQAWSGLTRLSEPVDGIRARLRVVRDEEGRELFDVPEAPLTDPDLPVPVRFLPGYDNLLLGHADRARVIDHEARRRVMPGRALVLPSLLIDGFVGGTWSVEGSTLAVAPFRPLPNEVAGAVLAEADRLAAFVGAEEVSLRW